MRSLLSIPIVYSKLPIGDVQFILFYCWFVLFVVFSNALLFVKHSTIQFKFTRASTITSHGGWYLLNQHTTIIPEICAKHLPNNSLVILFPLETTSDIRICSIFKPARSWIYLHYSHLFKATGVTSFNWTQTDPLY